MIKQIGQVFEQSMVTWKMGQIARDWVQGRFGANNQLPIHFSMLKPRSNSNFLFEIYKQAGRLLKSATHIDFHLLINPREWFENGTKSEYANFDFLWKPNKLT